MSLSPAGPLAGIRVLVTRAGPEGEPLSRRLEGEGAEVVRLPTIEIRDPEDWGPVDAAIGRLASYSLVIFTSANGVAKLFDRLEHRRLDAGALAGIDVAAIGPATAAALARRGVAVTAVPEEYRAEGVLEEARRLLAARRGGGTPRVLLPRAAEAREVLPEGLRRIGVEVDVVAVYRTVLPEGGREAAEAAFARGIQLITFTSSSTVRNFVRLVGDDRARALLRGVAVGCIGPITAATAREAGLEVAIQPAEYTLEGFAAAAVEHFRRPSAGG